MNIYEFNVIEHFETLYLKKHKILEQNLKM